MRNPWLCISIVSGLILAMLTGIGGIIALACLKLPAPESLTGVVFTCTGALASFLVQPPRGSIGIPGGASEVTELTVTKGRPLP